MHNVFSCYHNKFSEDFEQLRVELPYFFKASSARSEDFKIFHEKCKKKKHIYLWHVLNQWFTLEDVTNRLEKEHSAIERYSLHLHLLFNNDQKKNER